MPQTLWLRSSMYGRSFAGRNTFLATSLARVRRSITGRNNDFPRLPFHDSTVLTAHQCSSVNSSIPFALYPFHVCSLCPRFGSFLLPSIRCSTPNSSCRSTTQPRISRCTAKSTLPTVTTALSNVAGNITTALSTPGTTIVMDPTRVYWLAVSANLDDRCASWCCVGGSHRRQAGFTLESRFE